MIKAKVTGIRKYVIRFKAFFYACYRAIRIKKCELKENEISRLLFAKLLYSCKITDTLEFYTIEEMKLKIKDKIKEDE